MSGALIIEKGEIKLNVDDSVLSAYADIYSEFNMSNLRTREGFRESTVPLQMTLITYEHNSPGAYKISFFSPGNYAYSEIGQDLFGLIVPQFELHTHNTYELYLVRSGTLSQRIESHRHIYPEGSCFLLNRNVRHNEEYSSSFSVVGLSISEELLHDIISEEFSDEYLSDILWDEDTDLMRFLDAEFNEIPDGRKTFIDFIPVDNGQRDRVCENIFEEIAQIMLDPQPGYLFLIKSKVCRLLSCLSNKEAYTTQPTELGTAAESKVFSRITKELENGHGRVSRNELERKLHYSGNYLNRISHKYTGMNLTEYANSIAMRYAASMLVSSDLTISEIAEKLSFSNRRYFYNEFQKAYGCTPKQYRNEHR